MSEYHERIDELNKDADERVVWDSIDRPIRPLVWELNRIGLLTKFSCCGFNYPDEEEPKTHYANGSYVHFFTPQSEFGRVNFFKLTQFVGSCGWKLHFFTNSVWNINAPNQCSDNMYDKTDGIDQSIHQYESFVLSIQTLTDAIHKNIPSDNTGVQIIDGNAHYKGFPEWQVKPKKTCIVTRNGYIVKETDTVKEVPSENLTIKDEDQ